MRIAIVLICAAIAASSLAEPERPLRIRAEPGAYRLACCYVKRDVRGRHGYAAQDARYQYFPIDKIDLFDTLDQLKTAIRKDFAKAELTTSGFPDDFLGDYLSPERERALSRSEMEYLRKP